MSTEPSPTDGGEGAAPNSPDSLDSPYERPAPQRRRQLSVIAVATAVLLAGGGGAYWASTAAGGGDSAGPGGTSEPAPLALDGLAAQQQGGDGSEDIAPGEPTNAQTYRATGELPDGPRSAPVYRTKAGVPRDAVAALAKTLDVPGTPEKKDGRWVVGSGDGSDAPQSPALTVNNDRSTGNWTYQQQGSTGEMPCATPLPTVPRDDPAQSGGSASSGPSDSPDSSDSSDSGRSNTVCPSVPDSGKGDGPVSEQKAKSAVRPTLKTLKLTDATLDAKTELGSLRMVTAAPKVDGMPTQDWNSTFTVGPDGKVVRGHGNLGALSKGASYPVMTAKETLKHLNKQGAKGSSGVSSSVREPMPEDAKSGKPASEQPPSGQPDPRKPVKVTGADFGLVTHYAAGKPVLVPSWIYEVDLRVGGHSARVAHPAVQPKFLKPSQPEQPGSGQSGSGSGQAEEPGTAPIQAVKSYKADGRTLKLTFWGGVCGGYTASAAEGGKSAPVKVTVRPKKTDSKKVCVKIAKRQTVEVELDKELGDRKVVDARDGEGVPRAK